MISEAAGGGMSASHCAVVSREYHVVACRLQHALDFPDEDMRCRYYLSFYYHQKRPCIAKAATDSTAKLPPPTGCGAETSPGKPLGILRFSQPKREEQRPAHRLD